MAALDGGGVADREAAITATQGGFDALRATSTTSSPAIGPTAQAARPYRALIVARASPNQARPRCSFPTSAAPAQARRIRHRSRARRWRLASRPAPRLRARPAEVDQGATPKGVGEMKSAIAVVRLTRMTPGARAYWWVALGVLKRPGGRGLPDAARSETVRHAPGGQVKKLSEGQTDPGEAPLRRSPLSGGMLPRVAPTRHRARGVPARRHAAKATASETERLLPHPPPAQLIAAAKMTGIGCAPAPRPRCRLSTSGWRRSRKAPPRRSQITRD